MHAKHLRLLLGAEVLRVSDEFTEKPVRSFKSGGRRGGRGACQGRRARRPADQPRSRYAVAAVMGKRQSLAPAAGWRLSSRDRLARGASRRRGANAIDGDQAAIDANLDPMMERVALLPDKRFYLIVTWTGTALLSGVILFAEELRALIGI